MGFLSTGCKHPMSVCWLCSVVSPQYCDGITAIYAIRARNDALGRYMGQYSAAPIISMFNVTETFEVGEVQAQQLSAT